LLEQVTLLIDGDILAFKAAARNQKTFEFSEGDDKALHLNDAGVLQLDMQAELNDLMETLEATDYIIFLTCPSADNWRKTVLPSYKANRDPANNPKLLKVAREILRAYHPCIEEPTLEADDLMGIYSTDPDLIEGDRVIVSIDKDMKTIPGHLYNPDKDSKARYVSEAEADRFHLYQTLIGDTTDNYTGCPSVGPETAKEFLLNGIRYTPYEHEFKRGPRKGQTETRFNKEPADSAWESVVSIYEKQGLTEEAALVQARVARILRAGEYDFKTQKVKLWNPWNRG
jgi:5'-3' exonuclease